MASSALESVRRTHEDYERALELSAAALSLAAGGNGGGQGLLEAAGALPRAPRDAEHLARGMVDIAASLGAELPRLYEAVDAETAKVSAGLEAANPLSTFYARLRDVKGVHHAASAAGGGLGVAELSGGPRAMDAALAMLAPPPPAFSGEEGSGRYLDLHVYFAEYANLTGAASASCKAEIYSAMLGQENKSRQPKRNKLTGKRTRSCAEYASAPTADGSNAAEAVHSNDIAPNDDVTTSAPDINKKTAEQHAKPGSRRPPKKPRVPILQRVDYIGYLKKDLCDFSSVPIHVRGSSAFSAYLDALLEYLVAFADRLHPLSDVRSIVEKARSALREELDDRLAAVRNRYLSPDDILTQMGADGVKGELALYGLKCGGRPTIRAERLWTAAGKGKGVGERIVVEALIKHVVNEMLCEERRATVLNVEKKQSLSWVELEAERVAEEAVAEGGANGVSGGGAGSDDDEDDAEKPVYNPKDIPLGWDGKPIPFWLYKLHGLNHEFRCEVCGDGLYKGPRAFERHFTDAQHVHGLRCLDVNYSRDYFMVTKIADVVVLRDKLAKESEASAFDPDAEMEFEDAEGNVFNRKTYQDLERQGLL
jgi:hypothetical protein